MSATKTLDNTLLQETRTVIRSQALTTFIADETQVNLEQKRVTKLAPVEKVYLHWTTRDKRTFDWLTQHVADFEVQVTGRLSLLLEIFNRSLLVDSDAVIDQLLKYG